MPQKKREPRRNDGKKDPTGIIFDIKRYAIHDGPGIRTTIFFKGCPLRCWWCHNPEGLRPGIEKIVPEGNEGTRNQPRTLGERRTVQSVMDEIGRDIIFFDESLGGVTFSGGEPLMQPEFLRKLLIECHRSGIHTTLDTCGYAPRGILKSVMDLVDLFLYDIKFVDPGLHKTYTGRDNHSILSNLKTIDRHSRRTVIRFPLVPGITDSKENLSQVLRFLSTLKAIRDIDLLPYHNLAAGKYRRLKIKNRLESRPEPNPQQTVAEITRYFESRGFRVNRGGNHE